MTASALLDNLVAGQTYQVTVTPNPGNGGRTYHWSICRYGATRIPDGHYARMVADGYTYPQDDYGWLPLATLTTPPVTDEQAKPLALAWLAAVEGADPATVDCLLMLPGSNERIGPAK